jgi:predicted signal transduction protein with EAL and GGDEF domain
LVRERSTVQSCPAAPAIADRFIARIQELGVRIAFNLLTDRDDAAIVSSTVVLGKQLGLSVIAEGSENRATADLLATMGCEEGQGYFFARPLPAAEIARQFLSLHGAADEKLAS